MTIKQYDVVHYNTANPEKALNEEWWLKIRSVPSPIYMRSWKDIEIEEEEFRYTVLFNALDLAVEKLK